MISIDDFKKVEMRVGKVLSVERVPDTEKLLILMVDFGEEKPRQVISGIALFIANPDELVGKLFPFVTNLETRVIQGLESQAMILATGEGDTSSLFSPLKDVALGSLLR